MKNKISGKHILASYLRLFRCHGKWIPVYCFLVLMNGAAMYAMVYTQGSLLKEIMDIATGDAIENSIQHMIVLTVITCSFVVLSGFARAGIAAIQIRTGNVIRMEMLAKRTGVLECESTRISDSDVFTRLNDDLGKCLDTIGTFMEIAYFNPILSGLCSLVTIGAIDIRMGVFSFLFTLVLCGALDIIRKKTMVIQQDIQKDKSNVMVLYSDILNGKEETRIFKLCNWHAKKMEKVSGHLKKLQNRFVRWNVLRVEIFTLEYTLMTLALLAFGVVLSRKGLIAFSEILIAIPLSGQVMQMVQGFAGLWSYLSQSAPSMDRVLEVIDERQEDIEPSADNQSAVSPDEAEIIFSEVSFGYTKEKQILDKISFRIPAGKTAAFVGASGCGKSTILKLLEGFYLPDCGTITINGKSCKEVGLGTWRNYMAYIQQNCSLFNTSIQENITLGNHFRQEEELKQAMQDAGVDEFVYDLDGQTAYEVGEAGSNLSGGQRQRVSIARGLLVKRPIIVLDEPTAAVDNRSELHLKKTLQKLKGKHTIVMVSHKLSFSKDCDMILVLDQGKIAEIGTHEELLQKDEKYAALWKLQMANT